MKNKIMEILLQSIVDNAITDEKAAKLIEQLMCNESVKLLMISDEYHDNPIYMVEYWWYQELLKSYSESTIKTAIEKCKEENKCK